MQKLTPEFNFKGFKLNKLNTPEFRHLKLLLFWPVFGILFMFTEQVYDEFLKGFGIDFYPVHCKLDDTIPFNELFLIPYLFWFADIVLMLAYTLFYDTECFRSLMKFFMITYISAIVIYLIFPTEQNLRPTEFERSNILTDFIKGFYSFDTNTNVCPSIHVMGALACLAASLHAKHLDKLLIKIISLAVAVLICLSTVFLKQHSVLDIFAALPICLIAYLISFKDYRVKVKKRAAVKN